MANLKKFLAILMTASLVLSFAACGGKQEEPTEVQTQAMTDEVNVPHVSEETTAEQELTTEATTAEETTAVPEETTTEASKAPQSTEEIVKYFNDSVNAVKTDAKGATRNYSDITLAGSCVFPSSLNTILKLLGGADKFIGDQLKKQSKGKQVLDDINGVFPVEKESWASKLTAADVSKATCEEKDGKYYITIVTLADSKTDSVQHGQGHVPKAFNAVLPETINENIPGIAEGIVGTAKMNYPRSTAKIVVDPATGHVLSANYKLYWTINFDKVGASLPFCTEDDFTIAW